MLPKPDTGDADILQKALHRSNEDNNDYNNDYNNDDNNDDNITETLGTAQIVSTADTAETLRTAPGAAQIVRTAKIKWIQRAALVIGEAANFTIRASQIVEAAWITETLRESCSDRSWAVAAGYLKKLIKH